MYPEQSFSTRGTPKSLAITCLATMITLALAAGAGAGNATLQAGNSFASTNMTGYGHPLDSTFTFEIGTFDAGLTPSPFNTLDWLDHWHPLTDAQGIPLTGATVPYDDSELGSGFPPGTYANHFSMDVALTHNNAPFTAGRAVYIWGFDRRLGGGNVEWILIKNPGWTWPVIDPATGPVFQAYDVSHPNSVAVIGLVNSGEIEMQTGTVTLSTPLSPYDSWQALHFTSEELADPAQEATRWGFLADPDGDGIPNAVEFVTGTLPTNAASAPATTIGRSGNTLTLDFTRLKNPGNILAGVQWSANLTQWSGSGVTESLLEDLGDRERIRATITVPAGGRAFVRFYASEQSGAG